MFLPDRRFAEGWRITRTILPLALLCIACGGSQRGSESTPETNAPPVSAGNTEQTPQHQTERAGGEKLPESALVIDSTELALPAGRRRTLYLWSINPARHPRENPDDPYTCPEETRGSFYRGVMRLSLIDGTTGSIINTIDIAKWLEGETFDIPYSIRSGLHYQVPGTAAGAEGTPKIMYLRDYNGDGDALEFALFDAVACMGLQTALFGYSMAQDRAIQYPVELSAVSGNDTNATTLGWADRLFREPPVDSGHWKYEIDYRGRGGTLDTYDVRYDAEGEKFTGTLIMKADEE